MADDTDIDELVLAGHGGALHHADDGVDPNEARRDALERRLKCEVIRVAEEAAREKGVQVSPHVAQVPTPLDPKP
jgi:centromere protein S